jgi:hypothetical protein
MAATSKRLVLPKPTSLHSPPRSPSLEGQGGRYDCGSSGSRNARIMATREDRSADRKKVRFPPPKAWDPEVKWTQECVMFQECGEKHSPTRCEAFKKMTPQQRLKKIDEWGLCKLCYRHLQGRECWSLGRVPNCSVDGCKAPHHPLLHAAIVAGRVMIVQRIGEKKAQTHLCREDVFVEVAGKTNHLHTLYDWGTSVTIVTYAAAEKAGLRRVKQPTTAVAGLSGGCTTVNFHYMVSIVDRSDRVQVVKVMGVDSIRPWAPWMCLPT